MKSLFRPQCLKQTWLLAHTLRTTVWRRCIATATNSAAPKRTTSHEATPKATAPNLLPIQVRNVELPKLLISNTSPNHNSLQSFLEYAERTNLDPQSSHYLGTHYEYVASLALLRLGFSFLRVGKRGDAGIDLMGHWVLPQFREPIPVIAQCKARMMPGACTPSTLRELEGSFGQIPPSWRNKNVLGLVIATTKPSKGVLSMITASPRPLGFIMMSRTGVIQQFVWNRAASERGLEGVGVTVRHTPYSMLSQLELAQGQAGVDWQPPTNSLSLKMLKNPVLEKMSGTRKDIQLTWMGHPIFPGRDSLDDETIRLMHQIGGRDDPDVAKKFSASWELQATYFKRKVRERAVCLALNVLPQPVRRSYKPRRGKNQPKVSPEEPDAQNTSPPAVVVTVKRKPGRPVGAKNKVYTLEEIGMRCLPRKRGRPAKADLMLKAHGMHWSDFPYE